ncbi:arylformamidase [Halobacillus litoralis]|uniref:arylformamidase n=1 Tax=Halobacillus litoralis TaxID=45668 RepID=UPI001CFEC157|nr:arylformamidase [Halobacillus litoralis]
MKWIDISMPLNNATPPWPGDEPFHYSLTYSMDETGSVNIGQFRASNHIGTHVDAPFHYDSEGKKIADLPVERFTGKALVLAMENQPTITREDLQHINFQSVSKVLFKTNSWNDRTSFPDHYTVIGEGAASYLSSQGINMIGMDTPSVDPETSKDLPGHHSLYKHDILILEGIQLSHVSPGTYELMAFPLKMEQADGSPVRAVLREI